MERTEPLEAIYLSILTFIEIERSFEVMDRSLLKAISLPYRFCPILQRMYSQGE